MKKDKFRRDPDLLDAACDREVLIYAVGICLALAALGLVMIWR